MGADTAIIEVLVPAFLFISVVSAINVPGASSFAVSSGPRVPDGFVRHLCSSSIAEVRSHTKVARSRIQGGLHTLEVFSVAAVKVIE